MSYVTVPSRPLLSAGTWNASTGEEVITEEDLHAIVRAAQSGVLDAAVIKKGHLDENYSEFNADGSPAFGQVTNLRVKDGTLFGDYVNVPVSLAESLASAYPHVSVELARNVKLRDATGSVAHSFDVVLTAAALLGATPPAVKGLSQKAYAFSEDAYDYSTTIAFSEVFPEPDVELAAKRKTTAKAEPTEAPTDKPAEQPAEAPAEKQAQEPAPDPADTPDNDEKPADPENTGDDTADVPLRTAEIAESSPEAPAPTPAPPAPRAETNGVPTMSNIDQQAAALRKKYDLPENAPYKDVLQKVLEDDIVAGVQQNDKLDTRAGTDEEPDTDELATQIAAETEARQKYNLSEGKPKDQQHKETAAVDLDEVYVSRSAFSALMEEFEQTKSKLAAREAAEVKARRDSMVTSWFRAGVIGKDERPVVREQLDVAEESVVALMERRTPIYPVAEVGHSVADEAHFAESTDETRAAKIHEMDDAIFGA